MVWWVWFTLVGLHLLILLVRINCDTLFMSEIEKIVTKNMITQADLEETIT